MTIPFFGNDRETRQYSDTFHRLAQDVWETGQFLNGPWVREFEENLARFCHRKYAVTLNSCTDALIFGLESLQLQPIDVIVPNFSFLSSASAILHAGHSPLFCDVCKDTAMMTKQSLLDLNLEEKQPKVLVTVSLYGAMAPMKEVEDYCQEHSIILVEDAAQSLGSNYLEKPAGSFGAFSTLSFDPTKTLHAMGAGGALLTDDSAIYESVLEKRLHGRNRDMRFATLGRKSLLPSQDAHVMNFKLTKLNQWIKRRRSIAKRYHQALSQCSYAKALEAPEGSHHAYHKFVIKCDGPETRRLLQKSFKEADIVTRVHYDKPISHHEVFNATNVVTPHAEELSKTVLSLPIFHELTDDEVEKICEVVVNLPSS